MVDRTPQDLANEAEAKFRDGAMETLRLQTDTFYDALVTNANSIVAMLPESIFVNVFLPYFCGEKSITPDIDIIANWIGVAGTPMAEVSIIDAANKEVIRIPPLLDSNVIEVVKRPQGDSLADIMAAYDLRNSNLPVVANKYLRDALDSKATRVVKESDQMSRNEQRWNDVFVHYGKKSSNAAVSLNDSGSQGDDIEYD